MCWSADASILSFVVGCLGIVIAAFKGVSPFMILFFSTIVAMQLVEYVVWTYGVDSSVEGCGDARVSTVNFGASLAAASLLALQPIASILTVSQSYIPVAAYLIFAFFAHMLDNDARSLQERYKMTAEPVTSVQGCGFTKCASERSERSVSTPHLVWHWLTPAPIYSLLVYFFFLLTPLVISGNAVLLGVVLAALAFSLLFGTGGKGEAAISPLRGRGGVVTEGDLEAARATGVASPYWGSVWCYAIHCIVVVLCLVK